MKHVSELQAAFILHTRPYRNTSLLIDFFTQTDGRVTAISRGARSPNSKIKGILQAFTPLLINFTGSSDLMTLSTVEPNGMHLSLTGKALVSGFYLNEILMRLIMRFDAYPGLFEQYYMTLNELASQSFSPCILRRFEMALLDELGYGLHLSHDADSGETIKAQNHYLYTAGYGLRQVMLGASHRNDRAVFMGASLQAIHQQDFSDASVLTDSKRLMRIALAPLLGNKPIKSREMFIITG